MEAKFVLDRSKVIEQYNKLADLGLKLNDKKTVKSDNIIKDAIKPDKLYWEVNNKIKLAQSKQAELYIIRDLAEKYPNSGSIKKTTHNILQMP